LRPRVGGDREAEIVRVAPHLEALAFSGIHVISPRLLKLMTEEGVFSIIDSYLRLAAQGERIRAFHADEYYWRDLGKPTVFARPPTTCCESFSPIASMSKEQKAICVMLRAWNEAERLHDASWSAGRDFREFLILAGRVDSIR